MAKEFDPDAYLASKKAPAKSSEFDPDAYLASKEKPGLLSRAAGAVGEHMKTGLEFLDYLAPAPLRAGVAKAQDTLDPREIGGAMLAQYGKRPTEAPTGKMIAQRAGVPDTALSDVAPSMYGGLLKKGGMLDPTASGAAGFGLDVALDPNIPAKAAGIAGKAAKAAGSILNKADDVAKAAGNIAKNAVAKTTSTVGSTLTGAPKKDIKTIIDRIGKVDEMSAKYGDDITTAADEARSSINQQVQTSRKALNAQISSGIESKGLMIADAKPVIQELEKAKSKISKKYKPEDIAEIDEMITKLSGDVDKDGKILVSDLFDFYDYAKGKSKGSYLKGGQIFIAGDNVSRAAKQSTRAARKIIGSEVPEAGEALSQLSMLHKAEETAGKGLLKEGAPAGQLISAGRGQTRQAKALGMLQDITKTPLIEQAENVSALQTFGKPDLLPMDSTGKSFTRLAVGAGGGFLKGGPVGAVLGGIATSPYALKKAVQTGKFVSKVAGKTYDIPVGLMAKTLGVSEKVLSDPKSAEKIGGLLKAARATSAKQNKEK